MANGMRKARWCVRSESSVSTTTLTLLAVLDEAHKYLTNNDSARLTQSVGNIIRLQRHLATRVIIATQEPTVIPPTILDLASIIICHRFSSPAWCTHLAHHVSVGSESAFESWYQQVMLLPTGDALVFCPAGMITADERGGVGLLGREHLRLRVRPRLTVDGGASRLAVRHTFPALETIPAALPLLTPPTSASYLRSQHLQDTSTAPPSINPTVAGSAISFAPSSAPTNSTAATESPEPAPAAPLLVESTAPPVIASTAPSVVRSTASAQHAVPARLKHLVEYLSHGSPTRLNKANTALAWIQKENLYVGSNQPGSKWWAQMMQEAKDEGLIEVVKVDGKRTMRLVKRGPFLYV
jgi:hypothetical protein